MESPEVDDDAWPWVSSSVREAREEREQEGSRRVGEEQDDRERRGARRGEERDRRLVGRQRVIPSLETREVVGEVRRVRWAVCRVACLSIGEKVTILGGG